MKRTLLGAAVVAVATLLGPPVAAADSQPSQGERSTGRNDAGFGGGPHCHVLSVEQANGHFTWIRVFPSHQGHASSGLADGPFVADPDCDGLPGVTLPG
jgi:hypothetical protein